MNRRQFIVMGTVSAGTILGSMYAFGQKGNSQQPPNPTDGLLASKNGLLEVNLAASERLVSLGGTQAYLLSYNGQVPGPRLEAKPGDTVRIHLTNNLSQPTNLHCHGLHITPQGNGDNVFLSIPPQESLTYEFTIPSNHPAATFWYHPHRHGFVADQLFGGLAGLFVVRGEVDEIPELKAASEEFLVLQDFALGADAEAIAQNPMIRVIGREGTLVTINGQVNPSFSIASGGLLRLRLLNASPSRFYRLQLEEHPLYLIGTDSGALAEPVEIPELLLTPGERAEVLVRGERSPGEYRLLNLPYNRSGTGMMGNSMMNEMKSPTENQSAQLLATLRYDGSVSPLPLPKQLIPVPTLPEPTTVRRFEMAIAIPSSTDIAFMINGKVYDPQRIDTTVELGNIEDWEIVNVDPAGMDHSFHVHTNFFQVVARNGKPEPYRAWKDTVLVRGGETVRIRIPFRDFSGKTVYHCHILDHEDSGMMATLEIQPPGNT